MPDAPQVAVRPVESGDRQAVICLSNRLTIGVARWRDPDRVAAAVTGWLESSFDHAHEDGHAMFVATVGDRVVGAVSVCEREHFSGVVDAYVGELVTAEGMEGMGVGQSLMAAAEDWARERGLPFLTLETGAQNARARQFYKLFGYSEEDVRLTKRLLPDSVS